MKKIFFLGMLVPLLISCKSANESQSSVSKAEPNAAYQIQTENLKKEIYFRATGNEPFWGLKISNTAIEFTSLKEGFEAFIAPAVIPNQTMDGNVKSYRLTNGSGEMTIEIRKEFCQDNMSGANFPYVVTVVIKKGTDASSTFFKGCGTYVTDPRLHDIWVLEKLNGQKVSVSNFSGELPNLEINTTTNQFMGYAGCNRMNGTILFEKGLLRFTKIATTRMACESQNKEMEFLTALQSTTTYSIENLRLTLKSPSGVELVFKKVD